MISEANIASKHSVEKFRAYFYFSSCVLFCCCRLPYLVSKYLLMLYDKNNANNKVNTNKAKENKTK